MVLVNLIHRLLLRDTMTTWYSNIATKTSKRVCIDWRLVLTPCSCFNVFYLQNLMKKIFKNGFNILARKRNTFRCQLKVEPSAIKKWCPFYWFAHHENFPFSCLMLTAGESLLEKFEPVEDSKANTGEPGCLVMTNLRLLWYSSKTAKLNLSKLLLVIELVVL